MKVNKILLLIIVCVVFSDYFININSQGKIITKQNRIIQQNDSILLMQNKLFELDSCYLDGMRGHMGVCDYTIRDSSLMITRLH